MTVARLPLEPLEAPDCDPLAVTRDTLLRLQLILEAYQQPGDRPDPHRILMMIADVLREPELCEAAGIGPIIIIRD